MTQETVLRAANIEVTFSGLRAVDGVSFELAKTETLGIVGESGCGKSSLGKALIHMPPPSNGAVIYRGVDLASLKAKELRSARLDLQMVFQDPRSSLHPKRSTLEIVREPLDIWKMGTLQERNQRAKEVIAQVGLDPELHSERRASELSGGQCQRVAIARALVAGAKVLICDEPISSLDVSLRATILNLLEELKLEFELSIIFIAHDLAVVRNVSDRILVMYLGKVVEESNSKELFEEPLHPYTKALIASVPRVHAEDEEDDALRISGEPPSPLDVPSGCRFRTRCPFATQKCAEEEPQLRELLPGHKVACHYAE